MGVVDELLFFFCFYPLFVASTLFVGPKEIERDRGGGRGFAVDEAHGVGRVGISNRTYNTACLLADGKTTLRCDGFVSRALSFMYHI